MPKYTLGKMRRRPTKSRTIKKMNCSPAVKGKTVAKDTCYTPDALLKIRDAYNQAHPENKIRAKGMKQIWTQLRERLTDCEAEDCWLKQIKDTKVRKQLDELLFAPDQPSDWKKNPNAWLSNYDIENVLKQYEITHKQFKLLGPSSIDYDTHLEEEGGKCVWEELCRLSLKDLRARSKTKLGIVFNLDKHDQPGSHWVSMFVDLEESVIFYYDSALNDTPPEITRLKDEITKQGAELSPPIHFKYITNKYEHQRTNTECGMYSLFFIITFLTSEIDQPIKKFKKIRGGDSPAKLSMQEKIQLFTERYVSDHHVEKYRNILFNPTP